MNKFFLILTILSISFLVPAKSLATIGVGVGSGKIEINQELKPGGIYNLPVLSVNNNGDEVTEYEVRVTFNESQPEEKPAVTWFSFDPSRFSLPPTQTKPVAISMSVPLNAKPGSYFAYLEAHPVTGSTTGQTIIGIAAASKLYFKVAPANIFQGIYYRIAALMDQYTPWSWALVSLALCAVLITLLKRYFNFEIGIHKK